MLFARAPVALYESISGSNCTRPRRNSLRFPVGSRYRSVFRRGRKLFRCVFPSRRGTSVTGLTSGRSGSRCTGVCCSRMMSRSDGATATVRPTWRATDGRTDGRGWRLPLPTSRRLSGGATLGEALYVPRASGRSAGAARPARRSRFPIG